MADKSTVHGRDLSAFGGTFSRRMGVNSEWSETWRWLFNPGHAFHFYFFARDRRGMARWFNSTVTRCLRSTRLASGARAKGFRVGRKCVEGRVAEGNFGAYRTRIQNGNGAGGTFHHRARALVGSIPLPRLRLSVHEADSL